MKTKEAGAHPDDRSRETAALYALGALGPEEAQAFEAHLASGCSSCAGEAAAFREVLSEIGQAAGAQAAAGPPAGLRAKLLSRLRAEKRPAAGPAASGAAPAETQVWKRWRSQPAPQVEPGLSILRAGEGGWEPTAANGVSVKPLSTDPARRYVTMLVRMEPGSSYPPHRHAAVEECYVLQGELRVGAHLLKAGDYQKAEGGSDHGVQSTENGCLLLIVSSQDDELL
jgi:anti-sigma factor ChrR (cupin superfamily)